MHRFLVILLVSLLVVGGGVLMLLTESDYVTIRIPDNIISVEENSQTSFVVEVRSNCNSNAEIVMASTSCSCIAKPNFPVRLRYGNVEKLEFSIVSGQCNPDEISSARIRFFGHYDAKQ
ncbi:hypothetical protein SH449x_003454 [Pirellulaceae bacterium SH449]